MLSTVMTTILASCLSIDLIYVQFTPCIPLIHDDLLVSYILFHFSLATKRDLSRPRCNQVRLELTSRNVL
jgi:hypothetical protein